MLCGHPVEDVINSPLGRGFRKDRYTHTHLWLIHVDMWLIHMMYGRNQYNILKQLAYNLKKRKKISSDNETDDATHGPKL